MKSVKYKSVPGVVFFKAGTLKKVQLFQQCSGVPSVPPKGGIKAEHFKDVPSFTPSSFEAWQMKQQGAI